MCKNSRNVTNVERQDCCLSYIAMAAANGQMGETVPARDTEPSRVPKTGNFGYKTQSICNFKDLNKHLADIESGPDY